MIHCIFLPVLNHSYGPEMTIIRSLRMYRASRLSSAIRTKSTYSAYNRNKLVPGAENPYDCNPRCSLCGTNMG